MQPHQFWQEVFPPGSFATTAAYEAAFPVTLPDRRQLLLPIRPLPDGQHALASLIINQASFAVQAALAEQLASKLAAFRPEVIVGLPTLGLTLAAAVAQRLGHARYVPLGTSRKFWYEERLSVPLSSITTPGAGKRLYLDPRLLPLLTGHRVALIDDVISTGSSIVSGLELLAAVAVAPAAIGAATLQSDRWRANPGVALPDWQHLVVGVFETPMLSRKQGGWAVG